MTPGPVSDSYDPEFGTGANAQEVRDAIAAVRARVTRLIGSEQLRDIVEVAGAVNAHPPPTPETPLWEAELRVIRFCLDRASESV